MVIVDWSDQETQLEAEAGERLLDVADERPQTGTQFACRSGHCGTCLVSVVTGHALLAKPRSDELETLQRLCAPPEGRLACQLTIARGVAEGRVRLARVAATEADPVER